MCRDETQITSGGGRKKGHHDSTGGRNIQLLAAQESVENR